MVCYISACGKKEQGNSNMDGTMSEETGQQYDGIFPEHAEYCIALKGNQPTLCKDVEEYFGAYTGEAFLCKHLEKRHGRIEIREYYLSCDIGWMEQKDEWGGLKESEW